MPTSLTKFLALVLPLIIGALQSPDIAKLWAGHPGVGYLISGVVTLVAAYLGIGVSGPTAAPRTAAALGNPGAVKPDDAPKV